jgi:periplasmic protein TonB
VAGVLGGSHESRTWLSAGISLGAHAALFAMFALIVVRNEVEPPEFVELNIGRLSQRQLSRMIEQSERAPGTSAPQERMQTPQRRLPQIDTPGIRPTEVERRLLPDRVSLDEEKAVAIPSRPTGQGLPSALTVIEGDRKARYEGGNIDVGPRPGEGIESEHVGSDIQPVFLIEGELTGRRFQEAALTTIPDISARIQVQVDLIVAPSGSVISAIVRRKENAALEQFAVNYLRRSRFDPLPPEAPQENQNGRITITFASRPG